MRSSSGGKRATPREAEASSDGPRTPAASLQLAVTRKGVGLELTEPLSLGAIRADRVEIALPGLRFPVDLSGGVDRFRHRRGRLLALALSFPRDAAERAARSRLAGLFAEPRLTLLPEAGGIFVGIAAESWALAAQLSWAPDEDGPRLMLTEVRAAGLAMPAHEAALLALDAVFAGLGKRSGSFVRFASVAGRVLREALADTGARLPETDGLVWGALEHREGEWRIAGVVDGSPSEGTAETTAALELSRLLVHADDELAKGDHDIARERYLAAWEEAPKHGAIARRVAEIDLADGRPEAGLSILTTTESAVLAGALGAALLEAAGDRDGAREAFTRAGETEAYAPLAALCLARAAGLCDHPGERAELLRGALSRAPTVEALRWPRLEVLLELGDERGARAEAEGVSAIAPVGRRFEVTLRLGRTFLARGHGDAARLWFERALLFSPRSAEALVGLGEAMLDSGSFGRSCEVLARAADALRQAGKPQGRALLALGRALAEGVGDFPLAIARARGVRSDEPEAAEARFWEASWLMRLGDRAEASLAFVRMLDAEERSPHPSPDRVADWLLHAARFERDERGDLALAKRHLGLAIRRRSKDPVLLAEFRRAARDLEEARGTPARLAEAPPARPTMQSSSMLTNDRTIEPPALDEGFRELTPRAPTAARGPAPGTYEPGTFGSGKLDFGASDDDEEGNDDESNDAALADKLTDRLRADPTDLEVALELCSALERLGRDLELLGVLSARIEEGDEEARSLFAPLRRTTLTRLARQARAAGRASEAELYESMRDA